MFTVILAVVALADYVITVYCIVNMISKPTVKAAEIKKYISAGKGGQAMNNTVMEHINGKKESSEHIEDQNLRIALLSLNVDKILSNIDSIIEKNKGKQRVLL